MTDEKTLNIDQAVAASGVSRRTLYYWMAIGRLPHVAVLKHRRMRLSDILAVKAQRPSKRRRVDVDGDRVSAV